MVNFTHLAIIFFALVQPSLLSQRSVSGKIIDDQFNPLIGAVILSVNNQKLGASDIDGAYKINVPNEIDTLRLAFTGYETAIIHLQKDCSQADVVLQGSSFDHYKSISKIERKRKIQYNKLKNIYNHAYETGLFDNISPCYRRSFKSLKKELSEIKKEMKIEWREQKTLFRKLVVNDIVTIPFSGSVNSDGTGRTSMSFYSVAGRHAKDDCIIQCKILSKKNRILLLRIINMDACVAKEPILDGLKFEVGRTFEASYYSRILATPSRQINDKEK